MASAPTRDNAKSTPKNSFFDVTDEEEVKSDGEDDDRDHPSDHKMSSNGYSSRPALMPKQITNNQAPGKNDPDATSGVGSRGNAIQSSAFVYVQGPLRPQRDPLPPATDTAARLNWLVKHHGPNRFGEFFVQRHRESLKETTYFAYVEKRSSGSNSAAGAGSEAASQAPPSTPREYAAERDIMMWGRRWLKARASQYVVSTSYDDLSAERQKRSSGYLGKLKAVQGERYYVLYDSGEKATQTRRELAAIVYTHERAVAGVVEPKMEVAVPSVASIAHDLDGSSSSSKVAMSKGAASPDCDWAIARPSGPQDPWSLSSLFSTSRYQGTENFLQADAFTAMREMPPDASLQGFTSRWWAAGMTSDMAKPPLGMDSVKNFRLHLTLPSQPGARASVWASAGGSTKADSAMEVPLLVLEKLEKDRFRVRYSQPLSALQAFGVVLSRFDTKQVK